MLELEYPESLITNHISFILLQGSGKEVLFSETFLTVLLYTTRAPYLDLVTLK